MEKEAFLKRFIILNTIFYSIGCFCIDKLISYNAFIFMFSIIPFLIFVLCYKYIVYRNSKNIEIGEVKKKIGILFLIMLVIILILSTLLCSISFSYETRVTHEENPSSLFTPDSKTVSGIFVANIAFFLITFMMQSIWIFDVKLGVVDKIRKINFIIIFIDIMVLLDIMLFFNDLPSLILFIVFLLEIINFIAYIILFSCMLDKEDNNLENVCKAYNFYPFRHYITYLLFIYILFLDKIITSQMEMDYLYILAIILICRMISFLGFKKLYNKSTAK